MKVIKPKSASNQLTNDIVNLINMSGGFAFRVNSMGIPRRVKEGKIIWGKSKDVGIADIIGVDPEGGFLAIEVKIKDQQSPEQQTFQMYVEQCGGLYWLCRTTDEFISAWNDHFKRKIHSQ